MYIVTVQQVDYETWDIKVINSDGHKVEYKNIRHSPQEVMIHTKYLLDKIADGTIKEAFEINQNQLDI